MKYFRGKKKKRKEGREERKNERCNEREKERPTGEGGGEECGIKTKVDSDRREVLLPGDAISTGFSALCVCEFVCVSESE